MGRGQGQAARVAARQDLRLSRSAPSPDGPHGVDDVAARKPTGRGENGFPGGKRTLLGADPPALFEDRGTARAMDGAVDAAAAQERRVRGVDDGVDVLAREVAVRPARRGSGRAKAAAVAHGSHGAQGREEGLAFSRPRPDYLLPSDASLAAFATTNFSRRLAGILIASPVWGFRPMRAL